MSDAEEEQPEFSRIERWLLAQYVAPEPAAGLSQSVLAQLFAPRELAAAEFKPALHLTPLEQRPPK